MIRSFGVERDDPRKVQEDWLAILFIYEDESRRVVTGIKPYILKKDLLYES